METEETEAVKFVEWNFIVPEDYHNEKGIVTHTESFGELYAQEQQGKKYVFDVGEMPEKPELTYQFDSLDMPLNAIITSGPNGGGGPYMLGQ